MQSKYIFIRGRLRKFLNAGSQSRPEEIKIKYTGCSEPVISLQWEIHKSSTPKQNTFYRPIFRIISANIYTSYPKISLQFAARFAINKLVRISMRIPYELFFRLIFHLPFCACFPNIYSLAPLLHCALHSRFISTLEYLIFIDLYA